MKKVLIYFLFVSSAFVAYTMWYKSNHASVSVYLKFNKNERKSMIPLLHKAQVNYLDEDNNVLAKGIYDGSNQFGYLHLLNPDVNNDNGIKECLYLLDHYKDKQVQGKYNFYRCFKDDSKWVSKWIDDFKYLQVESDNCYSFKIPIWLTKTNNPFYYSLVFWSPHIDYDWSTSRHYSGSSLIDKSDCVALTQENIQERKGVKKIVEKNLTIKEKIQLKLAKRFKDKIDVNGENVHKNWQVGFVAGKKVWIEQEFGLIWGQRLSETIDSWGIEDGKKADKFCSEQEPLGYWGAPTQAEYYLSKRNGMGVVIDDLVGRWFARVYSQNIDYISGIAIGFVGFKTPRGSKTSIRCVAINKKSNRHGYYSGDFPLNYISSIVTDEMVGSGKWYKEAKKHKKRKQ